MNTSKKRAMKREVPPFLFHVTSKKVLERILEEGLVPKKVEEWKGIARVRVPVVWLAERLHSRHRCILRIDTDLLDRRRLKYLGPVAPDWWVYRGKIPPEAIELG